MFPMTHIRSAGAYGKALRERRRLLGLTQEDVAVEAGVGRRFVIELERGKPGASLEHALRVAALLGLEVDLVPRERG
jgi:HTH-type transcriptional regulator / antitoxin HipB